MFNKHSGSKSVVELKRKNFAFFFKFMEEIDIDFATSNRGIQATLYCGDKRMWIFPASHKWSVRTSAFANPVASGNDLESALAFYCEQLGLAKEDHLNRLKIAKENYYG